MEFPPISAIVYLIARPYPKGQGEYFLVEPNSMFMFANWCAGEKIIRRSVRNYLSLTITKRSDHKFWLPCLIIIEVDLSISDLIVSQ